MQDKAHAAQLKEEFLRSLMAGSIAAELCPLERHSEESFIGSMFQNLGRLLVEYYFPEEARQVRMQTKALQGARSESEAATNVLGLSFADLGIGVAKAWGLPQSIQQCMQKLNGAPPHSAPTDVTQRIRWIAQAANEMADVLLRSDSKDSQAVLDNLARKYAGCIGIDIRQAQLATARARRKFVELASAMEIRVLPGSAAARLLKLPDAAHAPSSGAKVDVGLGGLELHATQATLAPADSVAEVRSTQAAETLSAGIQDITNAMVEDFRLSDVLRMILETMYRALQFDRILFCMRDAKTEMMTGRFGLGNGIESHVKEFRTHLKALTPDLFGVVCLKGADTMITDATEARIVQRLPDWYRKSINAPTFLLLPLQIKGVPFGLIYADKSVRNSLDLDEKELALLRTLRNQAVMAFRQSS
jgi:hypothetical protein